MVMSSVTMAFSRPPKMTQLTGSLYVGGRADVTVSNIRRHRITDVINLSRSVPNLPASAVRTKTFRIEDVPETDISKYFNVCTDLIDQVSQDGGKTLVHCVSGVSRSVTICLAYLMKYYNITLRNAFRYVSVRRPIVNPNTGFWKQLIRYETRLFGHSSVTMVKTKDGWKPDVYRSYQDVMASVLLTGLAVASMAMMVY